MNNLARNISRKRPRIVHLKDSVDLLQHVPATLEYFLCKQTLIMSLRLPSVMVHSLEDDPVNVPSSCPGNHISLFIADIVLTHPPPLFRDHFTSFMQQQQQHQQNK